MPLWSPSNRLSHFKLAYVAVPMAFKSIGQGHGSLGGKGGLESMILCGERKAYPEIERPWPGECQSWEVFQKCSIMRPCLKKN